MKQAHNGETISSYPVLDGLSNAGFAGKNLAEIVGVSAPTLSKWRNGRSRMTGAQLVLLTLVLAHMIEEIEAMEYKMGRLNTHHDLETGFGDLHASLRSNLHEQEIRNLALAPAEVYAGARMYRTWYEETGGTVMLPVESMMSRNSRQSPRVEMVVS